MSKNGNGFATLGVESGKGSIALGIERQVARMLRIKSLGKGWNWGSPHRPFVFGEVRPTHVKPTLTLSKVIEFRLIENNCNEGV